jgi:hypothetical protein
MSNLPDSATKVYSYKAESTYAFGPYRIYLVRKSKGDGVYSRRQNWTDCTITSMEEKGAHYLTGGVRDAVKAIRKGIKLG